MNTHRFKTVGYGRVFLVVLLLALMGCSSITHSSSENGNQPANTNTTMQEPAEKPNANQVDKRLISANTAFGFRLFSELAKGDSGKNVFISPASVGLALAMTYNGAVGDTKLGMERALEIRGMNHLELNRAYAALKAALESADPKVQLSIANSLWGKKGVTFNPDFIKRNKDFYGAEVTTLDFNDSSAPGTINSWVSDKTKGKIDKIVDRIDPQAILFLINAIYFKGSWTDEFDKARTKDEPFTLATGTKQNRPMMHQNGDYRYLEGNGFQAVSLPYGSKRLSMYIFLPAQSSNLEQFQKGLTAENWDRWMIQFGQKKGEIGLPRFKLEYEVTLNDALKALGMGTAFDPDRADFTGIVQGEERAYINGVKHKTFVEVNEEGTEAAAVTSVEMRATSAMIPQKPFRMIVDRPFFCAIRDNTTGEILFMGSINNPS